MRALAFAAFLGLLALAFGMPLVTGQGAPPPAVQAAALDLGPQGGEATLRYAFQLAGNGGQVYAKLLPTPGNPAVGNGSVASDRSAGVAGWWVHLVLEPAQGSPIDLGYYADAGASPALALPGNTTHALRVTVHAPGNAGPAGSAFRVDLALAHRDEGDSAVDPSWGLAANLHVDASAYHPPALDLGAALPLLGGAAGVAALAALAMARRARKPRDWL